MFGSGRLAPRAALLGLVLAIPRSVTAAGYHLLKVDAQGGVNEASSFEGGLGLSLYSEELRAWITLGDTELDRGHRVKEWWFDSRMRGPVMGTLPPTMRAVGFDEPERQGRANFFIPFRSWRFGADYTSGHWLEWDASAHLLFNLGGLSGISHRHLLMGPTLGAGANLSWWEGWRGSEDQLINTGKITAEAGWIAGFSANDVFYGQGRLLTHVDAFGTHQHNLGVDALLGLSLVNKGLPLGLELRGRVDRGDDTVDLEPATAYTVSAALCYRLMPRPPGVGPDSLIDAVLESLGAQGEDSETPQTPPTVDDTAPTEVALPAIDTSEQPNEVNDSPEQSPDPTTEPDTSSSTDSRAPVQDDEPVEEDEERKPSGGPQGPQP